MGIKIINGMPLKEPTSNIERALLGVLEKNCQQIGYGSISIEVVVKKGEPKSINIVRIGESINADAL